MTRRGGRSVPRELRLNELLRQIIASELEQLDDERLELVGITEVTTDRDLTHATVYVSTWDESLDEEVLEALEQHRYLLQRAIGNQARLRRTPPLHFKPDEALRSANRIEELLRDANASAANAETTDDDSADGRRADEQSASAQSANGEEE